MIGMKKELQLTFSGDAAKELQLLAHHYGLRVEDLTMRTLTLLFEWERLSRSGYHLGMSRDASKLEVQFSGIWAK